MKLLAALLVAVPLSAQVPDQIILEPAQVNIENVINVDSIALTVEMPPPDSTQLAREAATERAMDAISEYIATCGCVDSGSNVSVVTNVGLTLAAFFIGWQLKRIADREPDVHNDGDVNVTVPAHEHGKKKRGESEEGHG